MGFEIYTICREYFKFDCFYYILIAYDVIRRQQIRSHLGRALGHLYAAHCARGVHPRRFVHGVSPYVVHGFAGSDDPTYQCATADSCKNKIE